MIKDEYEINCNTSSDIHEHLPILKKYAEECEHITEFGVREVVSTWAFLNSHPKKMISYDIYESPRLNFVKKLCKLEDLNFEFKKESTVECEIEETDLLFIDTWHIYKHLKKELELHGNKAKKYIILHDTTAYGEVGADEGGGVRSRPGLQQAINEFIQSNPQWKTHEVFTNNNGLTILKREQ